MFCQQSLFALILFVTFSTTSAEFPDYIRVCKQDHELSSCLIENAKTILKYLSENDGDQALNIININNMFLPRLSYNLGVDLPIVLTNNTCTGWGNFEPSEMSFKETVLTIKGHLSEYQIEGPYSASGKLLGIPLHGKGNWSVAVQDIDILFTTKLRKQTTHGKTFFYLDSSAEYTTLSMTSVGGLNVSIDKLLGDDPQLSREMNNFINNNWRDVFDAVHLGLEGSVASVLASYLINPYLKAAPIDKLFE